MKNSATPSSTSSIDDEMEPVRGVQKPRDSHLLTLIDWTLKILGAISGIIFGIWAPITYYASVGWNKGNNELQRQLVEAIQNFSRLGQEQIQIKPVLESFERMVLFHLKLEKEMEKMRTTIEKVGELKALEVCIQNKHLMKSEEAPCALDCTQALDGIIEQLRNQRTTANKSLQPPLTNGATYWAPTSTLPSLSTMIPSRLSGLDREHCFSELLPRKPIEQDLYFSTSTRSVTMPTSILTLSGKASSVHWYHDNGAYLNTPIILMLLLLTNLNSVHHRTSGALRLMLW